MPSFSETDTTQPDLDAVERVSAVGGTANIVGATHGGEALSQTMAAWAAAEILYGHIWCLG